MSTRGGPLADAGALPLALQAACPSDCPELAPLSAATRVVSWRGMAKALAGCGRGRGLLEVRERLGAGGNPT